MSVNPYLKKKKHGSYWDHTDSQSTSMTWCSCGLQILTAILTTLLRSSNSLLWSCSWGLHAPLLTRCYYPNPACKVYKLLLPSHACPWGVQAHAAAPNVFKSQKSSVSASESYKPLLWTDPAPSTILPLLLRCTSSSLLTIPCFLGIQAPDPLLTLKHSFWLDVPHVVLPKVLPKVYSFSALPYGPLPWNSCLWLGHWYLILLYFAKINK